MLKWILKTNRVAQNDALFLLIVNWLHRNAFKSPKATAEFQ
jgi:hypothetical protein